MPVDLGEIARNLELRAGGVWTAKTISQVSFPAEGHEHCFAVEDGSYWFRHRNDCIRQAIRAFPPPGPFFDIGGGNGYVARALEEDGFEVVLLEPGADGVRHAAERGVTQIIRSTLEDAGFVPGTVSAAGLFDVLEHVEDERAFLSCLYNLQSPGARLYLTVPASPFLWSSEDELAGHHRRYTQASLVQTLARAGYEIERAAYFFRFLWLPILLARGLPYRLGLGRRSETEKSVRADHEATQPVLRKLLDRAMGDELRRLARGQRILIGSSCLAVARKAA